MAADAPLIQWSVWDGSAVVSWLVRGQLVSVSLERLPLSVAVLPRHCLVAIVTDSKEHGSDNLRLYDCDGKLVRSLGAPPLGPDSHFGYVREEPEGVQAAVGFWSPDGWQEMAGMLDLESGAISGLHRTM